MPVAVTPAPASKHGVAGAPDIGAVYVSAVPYRRFTFGMSRAPVGKQGYARIGPEDSFDNNGMQGWLPDNAADAKIAARDRVKPDVLRRHFVYGKRPRTFRVAALTPGLYRLTVISGDLSYGDHQTDVSVAGAPSFPMLAPGLAEFATLTATVEVKQGSDTLDITFQSPTENWVVNVLTLEPVRKPEAPHVTLQKFGAAGPSAVTKVVAAPAAITPAPGVAHAATLAKASTADAITALMNRYRRSVATPVKGVTFGASRLSREDYLKLIAGEVDFWKGHQNGKGAIIDPYRNAEYQYSTPAYAHAAATLVAYAGRKDLLESASLALDWAARSLSKRKGAGHHEDFYAPMVAHSLRLLRGHADPVRVAKWEERIRGFDPRATYRDESAASNWNVVALSGEALFQGMGLRPKTDTFVADSLERQMRRFVAPYGLYAEGPMAYDHFPRIWAADMLARGYDGPLAERLGTTLQRAAVTSLFLQSPLGELPAGGRSAHHQWNEAQQCATFEIYAAKAQKAGDLEMAGAFKRAARLSLASMRRWVRPSGEMQIVKNWVDPAKGHGFEGYSSHSQYNLLPMSMLAIAYEHAAPTEAVPERPAPADAGGYALSVERLHKVFANVRGTYVEVDTAGDHHYDATGLIRVHVKGISPQLGPSDSLVAAPSYKGGPARAAGGMTTGVGISWRENGDGRWRHLGEVGAGDLKSVRVKVLEESPDRVAFDVVYDGNLFGLSRIVEHYTVTMRRVELTTEVPGYSGPLRYVWPVLADDGAVKSDIQIKSGAAVVSQDGGKTAQCFTAVGASAVRVEPELYTNRNGWVRLGVAEYPAGVGKVTLLVAPKGGA